jgi:uncharacterized phage infection (PIP) family protein YhgE
MKTQTIELKPARETIENVFLSPRVLDRAAFDDFSSAIKTLIERVTADTRGLQAAATQADAVHRRLSELAPVVERNITQAAGTLESVQTLNDQARATLAQATSAAERVSNMEQSLGHAIEARLGLFEARLSRMAEAAEAQISTLQAQLESRLGTVSQAVESTIAQAERRMEEIRCASSQAAEGAVSRVGSQVIALEQRVSAIAARLSTLADDGAASLRGLCERADSLLGGVGDVPAPGSLAEAVQRAENAHAQVEASHRHLGDVRDQADVTRRMLGQAILDSAGITDEITHRLDALRGATREILDTCNQATTQLAAKAEEFRGWVVLSQSLQAGPKRRRKPGGKAKPAPAKRKGR